MRRSMAYVVGSLCMAVAMVVYAQQGQREAAPAAASALDAAPVVHNLQLSVTGLPRRGESL
jgi:hypothetical protein